MELKRLIFRMVVRSIIIAVILTALTVMEPIITNDIALGQMQNSNEAFAIMSAYNGFKQFGNIAGTIAVGWYIVTAARDVYKFVENEKEN